MTDIETRRARAKEELLTKHGDSLRQAMGRPDIEADPRFSMAVDEVARGRCPQYVIMDIRGH